MLVRACLGHSAIESELEYLQMVFITCIQPLFFSLMMNSLTHTTDSLLETTKAVVRGLYNHYPQLERSVSYHIARLGLIWNSTSLLFPDGMVLLATGGAAHLCSHLLNLSHEQKLGL